MSATAQWGPRARGALAGVVDRQVRFQAPALPPMAEIVAYFARSEEERWFSNGGPNAQLLAERVGHYVGNGARAVLVDNATTGLMVALRALAGRPDGQRRYVVVPSYTFVATVNAISWCGFEPLFVDVAARGWHLDPAALAVALDDVRGRVAAVLACSTFGTAPAPADAERWEHVAASFGVPLLVDSAAGFGALDSDGRRLGTRGDAEVFSFHATKPFAIGEGGAITTRSPEIADRCARLANFGFDASRRVNDLIGLNGKLSELHAATGLAAFDHYGEVLAARRFRATQMIGRLGRAGFRPQDGWQGSTFQFVPVLAPTPGTRDLALRIGAERGVELRTYYDTPLHEVGPYRACARSGALGTTTALSRVTLSLPMANDLDDEAVERVVACCEDAARTASGRAA